MAIVAGAKDGLFQENFCSLLEGRLVSVVYRTNFLFNMFEIISFVRAGNVYINGILMDYVNIAINIGDFVTFSSHAIFRFKANLFKRLRTKTVLFNMPRFMFVHYKLFFAFFEKFPADKDLVYPIKLDIYRATAYY